MAVALGSLGNRFAEISADQEMFTALAESVRIYQGLAARDPDLYEADYKTRLGALLQMYDQRGMSPEAITFGLQPGTDPPA